MKKYTRYHWEGVTAQGKLDRGFLDAPTRTWAKLKLHKQGIAVTTIKQQRIAPKIRFTQTIQSAEITAFIHQLSTLTGANIPLLQALDLLSYQAQKRPIKSLIESMKHDLTGGMTLTESMQKHPRSFNALVCGLIHAGEQSGTLDDMLRQVANYQNQMERIKRKFKNALTYPLAVMMIAVGVTIGLLVFVVPQFELLFSEFGAELPIITKGIIRLSKVVQTHSSLLIILLFLLPYGINQIKNRHEALAYQLDCYRLKLPLIGSILEKTLLARFSRTLAITLNAGLPVIDAVRAASNSVGNRLYTRVSLEMCHALSQGQSMQAAMQDRKQFPEVVIQMVGVGEESGTLKHMLNQLAQLYEEDVNDAINTLSSLFEPAIMAILGLLVGGLVIAMYLPVFKLGSVV